MGVTEYVITLKNYNRDVEIVERCSFFIVAVVKFITIAYKAYRNKDVSFEYINFKRNIIG